MDTFRYPDPRYAYRSSKTVKRDKGQEPVKRRFRSQNTNPLNDKTTIAEAEVSQKQEKGARLNNVLWSRVEKLYL